MTMAENYHVQVNQAVSGLRDIYEEKVRHNKRLAEENEKLRRRITKLEELAFPAHSVTLEPQATYVNAVEVQTQRAVRAETLVGELQAQVRRQAEFMRLKDIAKMKVERDRDTFRRQRDSADDRLMKLHDQAAEVAELKKLNQSQADAFKEQEARIVRMRNNLDATTKKLNNVLDLIQRGERPAVNPYGSW